MNLHQKIQGNVGITYFSGRLPSEYFGTFELNYRVRDGNGWTLKVINTDYAVMDSTTDLINDLLEPKGQCGDP